MCNSLSFLEHEHEQVALLADVIKARPDLRRKDLIAVLGSQIVEKYYIKALRIAYSTRT